MLTNDELATIRAAFRYWQDEIVPAGPAVARHYMDNASLGLLSSDAIDRLIERFTETNVRYLIVRRQKPVSLPLPLPPSEPLEGESCVTVV